MKQVIQNLKTGTVEVTDIPIPVAHSGRLLIRTSASLISAGTERMLLEFGKAGWIEKARSQPERVRQVLDKLRTDGLWETVAAVRAKLDQPLPLGYCNVGRVVEVGPGVAGFRVGDRVVSNGWHAEVVAVPALLSAKVPDAVPDDAAAVTVLAAIALQGIRLLQPTLGERVAVIGLGLIGLLAVQLLRVHGCRVLGLDLNGERLVLARRFGAEVVDLGKGEDPVAAAAAFSHGRGIDAVLIAAATASAEPIRQAARMARQRGRIVLVGVVRADVPRDEFYKKELSFQVSCSYGPGRYDPAYEDKGQDYPLGFVRWTAQRNFEAVLELLADGRLDVTPLITHRVPIAEASRAYEVLEKDRHALGILLTYPEAATAPAEGIPARTVRLAQPVRAEGAVSVAVLGAGSHARKVLLPALRQAEVRLRAIVSANGVSAAHAGRRFGFELASSDAEAALADPEVNAVVIATRHDSHARFVCEALRAGKHVFCEKPLCLTVDELREIEAVYSSLVTPHSSPPLLMVGFNRRFAPLARRMRELLAGIAEPKALVVTVNAGALPTGHWVRDAEEGGGRIVGEACHFVDLARYLVGARITGVQASGLHPDAGGGGDQSASLMLRFADGSTATIHYFANGHRSFPKERIEAFGGGRILRLDNFRRLRGFGWRGFGGARTWRQDKGHEACLAAFVEAVRSGGAPPIPPAEVFEVSDAILQAAALLRC